MALGENNNRRCNKQVFRIHHTIQHFLPHMFRACLGIVLLHVQSRHTVIREEQLRLLLQTQLPLSLVRLKHLLYHVKRTLQVQLDGHHTCRVSVLILVHAHMLALLQSEHAHHSPARPHASSVLQY